MRSLGLVMLLASGCTLLHDWDSLGPPVSTADDDASIDTDGGNDVDVVTTDATADAANAPLLGCGASTCQPSEICCVTFEAEAVQGTCAARGTDAAAACAGVTTTGRLAGVLECDTSAQCGDSAVCCGDGKARLDNSTVYHARCTAGASCGGSGIELCGPGRAGPGDPSSCRDAADHCERTHDLDPVDDASEEPEEFPLLKCAE